MRKSRKQRRADGEVLGAAEGVRHFAGGGWIISKTHDNWEGRRNPNQTVTSEQFHRTLMTGTLPYLALVPIGAAMSMLRAVDLQTVRRMAAGF